MFPLKKNSQYKVCPAYTLLELLIAFSILVVISVMIAVPVVNGLGSKKLSAQVVGVMSDMIKAYSSYVRDHGAIIQGATPTTEVLDYLNYQKVDTSSTIEVPTGGGIPDGIANNNVTNSTCSDATPCLVTQDGGLLQLNSNTIFPVPDSGKIFSAIVMNFDPDGIGDQPATTIVLFSNGRVTTAPYVDSTVTTIDTRTNSDPTITDRDTTIKSAPFGNTNSDPEYMYGFTNDNLNN